MLRHINCFNSSRGSSRDFFDTDERHYDKASKRSPIVEFLLSTGQPALMAGLFGWLGCVCAVVVDKSLGLALILAFCIPVIGVAAYLYFGNLQPKVIPNDETFSTFRWDDHSLTVVARSETYGIHPTCVYDWNYLTHLDSTEKHIVLRYGRSVVVLPREPLARIGQLEWVLGRVTRA